ncbi:MAG: FtsW/RodA/SpoVE family cell cycle protein [Pirellulales bacterium]
MWLRRMPWMLLTVALVLIAIGWHGISRSAELGGASERLVRQQIVWSVLAVGAMLAVAIPNYRRLCRHSYLEFVITLAALVLVYFFPAVNGANRWIRLGPVGFQPSEFAKLAFVLALARYLMYRENYRRMRGLLMPLGIAMVPILLILREPDLGTACVFLPVLFAMLLVAGARWRDLAVVAAAGLACLPVLWTQMSGEQRSRVTALVHQNAPEEKPAEQAYHLHRAKQMIALGGMWGSRVSGPAVDQRGAYHVPEPATDSIFVVLVERWGQLGAAVLLALFLILAWRGLVVAEQTSEPFGRLAAAGIVALFAVEVVINTGMMVGLLPITGLSLPLVSYGGSGLLAHALAVGLLLNVGLHPGYEVAKEPFRFRE